MNPIPTARARAFVAAVCLSLAACGGPRAEAPRVTLESSEAEALLGDDDGFGAAVFYGAELMGSIDGCGCFGTATAGGVPFRFGYTEGFRAAYPGAGILQLDAGFSMASPRDAEGRELGDLVARDDAVLGAFDRLGYDAANATAHDIDYLARHLRPSAGAPPMASRFVSANLEPAGGDAAAPPAYVVRELSGDRVPGGRLRVAIAGVTEDASGAAHGGFRVADPAAALEAVLPKARAESDLVIVMAFMEADAARALAERLKHVADIFVVAHPTAHDEEPSLGAPPRITYARYKTMYLGELRLYFDAGRLARAANRYVKLYEPLPRDPLGERIAAEAKEAVKRAQLERFEAMQK